MRIVAMLILCILNLCAAAQNIRVHDPVMIKQNGVYHLFCTGNGISVFSSKDLKTWKAEKSVFDAPQAWAVKEIPSFKGHIWAPDISFHDGKYYLYYSVSAFGKNTSCIGVATNETLDPVAANFKWIDHGKVIQSVPGRDLWNAIDPNLAFDDQQHPWLVFGSFWSGMKLVKLDTSLDKVATPEEWYTVAKRARDFARADQDPGEAAVEAPFIFKRNNYYYLFVSFDFCCRGKESNYKIMIGRANKIQGPYLDRVGKRMDEGGGTLLLRGDDAWPGVGHNSVYTFDGVDYLVFHAYDAADQGKPKLKIETLGWDAEGWPFVKKD